MDEVLDNPAWNALVSGNKHLSNGNDRVKYFDKEVSPFAAVKKHSGENFRLLYELLPHEDPILFISPTKIELPRAWIVHRLIKGLQMVFTSKKKIDEVRQDIRPLTYEHVPQMMALTKLTDPGPFGPGTIAFGHYFGIFEGEQLVSMAGQRLHVFGYAEVSAVCTHPDHLGKGYARQLLLQQIRRIRSASEIPFLHVRSDNDRAIKVYESLGFSTRKHIYFYVLQKSGPYTD
jgi:ribosomal protein S18 acetylase RimI-like enzyme